MLVEKTAVCGRSAWKGSIYEVWLSNNKTLMMHLVPC